MRYTSRPRQSFPPMPPAFAPGLLYKAPPRGTPRVPHIPDPSPRTPLFSAPFVLGRWLPGELPAAFTPDAVPALVARIRDAAFVLRDPATGHHGLGVGGSLDPRGATGPEVIGVLAPTLPEYMGDRGFCAAHGLRYPYVAGEMANGIATTALVKSMASHGMLGFFGAAGLSYERVESAVDELQRSLPHTRGWGVNLIHSPGESVLEERVAAMLLSRDVPVISTSAFMDLTPAVARCALSGLRLDPAGKITRRHRVFAKVSRPEVARHFMSPVPEALRSELVARGWITAAEASLAGYIPVAEDVTVEADSGGHTDNRPMAALLPAMLALRDELSRTHDMVWAVRVGAGGGIGTPMAVAGAFALGAAYVVTGSINQACVEAGLSPVGKAMLAQTDLADVIMAPAADMFELGVNLQVLRRGTMFAKRAAKLYEVYSHHPSLESLSDAQRVRIEREVLGATIADVWAETKSFWAKRDPESLRLAEEDPKHRMALVFRWYLGKSSRWAIEGDLSRKADFQIWCGPAMGAFNRWVKGSFLETPEARTAAEVALNLMEGAAVVARASQVRAHGVPVPSAAFDPRPRKYTDGAAR